VGAMWKSTEGINLEELKIFARRKLYGGVTNSELCSSLASRLVPFVPNSHCQDVLDMEYARRRAFNI